MLQGEFIRAWIPELANIQKGRIHAPWTLSQLELATVRIGVDYPTPMFIAQEWTRHLDKAVSIIITLNFISSVGVSLSVLLTENFKLGSNTESETKGP